MCSPATFIRAAPAASHENHGNQSGGETLPSCQVAPSNGGGCVTMRTLEHLVAAASSLVLNRIADSSPNRFKRPTRSLRLSPVSSLIWKKSFSSTMHRRTTRCRISARRQPTMALSQSSQAMASTSPWSRSWPTIPMEMAIR